MTESSKDISIENDDSDSYVYKAIILSNFKRTNKNKRFFFFFSQVKNMMTMIHMEYEIQIEKGN